MASVGILPVSSAAFDDAASAHAAMSTLFDRKGALMFQNDAARAHFAAPTAGKRSANDLIRHFVDSAEGRRVFQAAVAGTSSTIETLVHTQGGPARYAIEISPAMQAGGVIAGIMVVEQPMPEPAGAPAEPAENPAHVFAQAGADWFWETDAALRIKKMSNRPGLAPTNFGADVMGALMFDPLPSVEGLDHVAIRNAVARREPFRELRFSRRHSSGRAQHFSVSGAPIASPDGRFLGYRGIGRDRTAEVIAEERAATAQARLIDAIESIPESFALLDRNDRLVLCNSKFRDQLAAAADWLAPGTRFEDIRRASARAGIAIPAIDGAGGAVEHRIGDRWFQLSARRTGEGGLAVVHTDITALKQREAELAEKSSVLRATLESMPQGVLVIDRSRNIVTWNDRMPAIHNMPRDFIKAGMPAVEIINFLAARGEYGPGDKSALAERRLEEVSHVGADSTVRIRPDGSTIEHRAVRMPTGGVVHSFTDVTAWKRREREIDEQRKLLAGTLANMDQGMLVLDSDMSVRIWNPRLADLLGLPSDALHVGMAVADLIRFMAVRLGMKGEAVEAEAAKRVDEFRAGDGRILTGADLGGRVVERRSRVMPDGGYVVTYTDYTTLSERERAIEEKSTLLSATLANMEQGILVLDSDLKIRMWNDRIAALFSLKPDFFHVGQSMGDLIRHLLVRAGRAPGDIEKAAATRLAAVTKRELLTLSGADVNGRTIERRTRAMPNGGYVVTYSDVTERKQRDQEIAEKSALLAATLDNMDQGLIVVDDNDRAKLWNNRLIDMFKLPPDVMRMGRPFLEIVRYFIESAGTPPDQVEAKVAERMAELHGEVIPVIDRYRPDGRVIERRRRVMPTGGSVITYGDVTERKRVEADLRRAKEEAEIASRSKTEFLANMSHELRTPLNAIIGFSDILVRQLFGPLGEKRYAEYARDISESGQHLLSLINDVLDIAKVEFNKVELNEEPVDIREIVAASVRLVTERAANGGVKLVVAVPDDAPTLRADDRRLKQVLLNLLSNAVKFTPPNGTVEVRVEWDAGGFRFIVADTGIGIAPDDLETALRPFGQIDSSLARRYEGTGLGLPLARSMVELHGGRLDIESTPGTGTKVTIWLPPERMIRDVTPPTLH